MAQATGMDEDFILLIDAARRLDENAGKPAIPIETVLVNLDINETELYATDDVQIE